MGVRQIERENSSKHWPYYLLSGLIFLLTVAILAALLYFRDEIQYAGGYGYAGGFLVSLLGGITIIPVPSLLVTFTLGRVLKPIFGPEYVGPVYVGLVSGLGEAIGGITVYLTGAGAETIWSRIRSKEQPIEYQSGRRYDIVRPVQYQFWSKGQAFYNHLMKWVGGRTGALIVFIVAAIPFSPFYFAGLAAGSVKMRFPLFFLASWAGKTIKGMAIAFAGYGGLYIILKWFGS